MKTCKRCNQEKTETEFRAAGKYRRSECRECEREVKRLNREKWKEDPEKVQLRNRKYYEENRNKIREQQAVYYTSNSDTIKERASSYYADNRDMIRIKQKLYYNTENGFNKHTEKRIESKIRRTKATPKWVCRDSILEFYKACPQGFHVDHIIPLKNDYVCGLNVTANFQYLTARENTSKQNKFDFTLANESWREKCYELKRVYSPKELAQEAKLIKKTDGDYSRASRTNKNTTHFNPHFYEIEKNLWQDSTTRERLLENRKKYLKKEQFTDVELLRGFKISGIHYGFSHHSPFWIKKFIEDFQVKSLYDPCGGWGHRMLGSHDINYIFNDIDQRSVRGALDMSNFLDLQNNIFYCEDASSFTPKEDYDAVFTCPPYFTTEIYQHKDTSTNKFPGYDNWLNGFWRELIRHSVKPGVKHFAYIMSDKYLEDMNRICEEEGLSLVFSTRVGKVNNIHFQNKEKDNRDVLTVFVVTKEGKNEKQTSNL